MKPKYGRTIKLKTQKKDKMTWKAVGSLLRSPHRKIPTRGCQCHRCANIRLYKLHISK